MIRNNGERDNKKKVKVAWGEVPGHGEPITFMSNSARKDRVGDLHFPPLDQENGKKTEGVLTLPECPGASDNSSGELSTVQPGGASNKKNTGPTTLPECPGAPKVSRKTRKKITPM